MLYNVLEQPGTMQRMWEGERALSATICHPPPTLAESESDRVAEYYKVNGSSLSLYFPHFQNGHASRTEGIDGALERRWVSSFNRDLSLTDKIPELP